MPKTSCIGEDVMVKYGWMILLGMSTTVLAGMYDYDIQKAQESCESEKRSLLRQRNGTPACDRVKQLMQMKRMEQNTATRRHSKKASSKQEPVSRTPLRNLARTSQIPDKRGAGYYWNHHFQRYCTHNESGYAVDCD